MKRGGRTSASAASIIPLGPGMPRIEPPKGFDADEKALWRQIVGTMPADWFDLGSAPMLAKLCEHLVAADGLKKAYKTNGDIELLKNWREETKVIASLATKLRLTPQSRYDCFKAANKLKNTVRGIKAWELDDPA
jgi:hypothetical protein